MGYRVTPVTALLRSRNGERAGIGRKTIGAFFQPVPSARPAARARNTPRRIGG